MFLIDEQSSVFHSVVKMKSIAIDRHEWALPRTPGALDVEGGMNSFGLIFWTLGHRPLGFKPQSNQKL